MEDTSPAICFNSVAGMEKVGMKIAIGASTYAYGVAPTDLAVLGEQLGYESMWVGEHPIIPVEVSDAHRYGNLGGVEMPEATRYMPDPTIWFTAAAAVTTRMKFGFSILLIPQHNPFALAKRIASMDMLSNGRILV